MTTIMTIVNKVVNSGPPAFFYLGNMSEVQSKFEFFSKVASRLKIDEQ